MRKKEALKRKKRERQIDRPVVGCTTLTDSAPRATSEVSTELGQLE